MAFDFVALVCCPLLVVFDDMQTSNLFVVLDGVVYTASIPSSSSSATALALPGHMRQVVIRVCHRASIPIIEVEVTKMHGSEEEERWKEMLRCDEVNVKKWDEAFTSSNKAQMTQGHGKKQATAL